MNLEIKRCNGFSIHKIKEDDFEILNEITKIISLNEVDSSFSLDDRSLTQSCQMSSLKQKATKCVNQNMQNLPKEILNQKSSQLCVPISVTTLLRYSIRNDLGFIDEYGSHSFENILSTLTMIVYPRSMAGLNLNPNPKEQEFQTNQIEVLLQRLCQKTYLMKTGWEIIRLLGHPNKRPIESICEYKKGIE